jgi:hypothetical protein
MEFLGVEWRNRQLFPKGRRVLIVSITQQNKGLPTLTRVGLQLCLPIETHNFGEEKLNGTLLKFTSIT